MQKNSRSDRDRDGTEDCDELKLSDIKVFLDVYDTAEKGNFQTFNDLFAERGKPTTIIGRLGRVCHYLFSGRPELKEGGYGFDALFERTGGKGLKPSGPARELYNRLKSIDATARDARHRFQDQIQRDGQEVTVLNLAASQTVAYRLLACAFSRWQDLFSKDNIELHVEIDTSDELVRRLHTPGSLDAVIAFGFPEHKRLVSSSSSGRSRVIPLEPHLDVIYQSLGYTFSSILIVPPQQQLYSKASSGLPRKPLVNDPTGYYEKLRKQRTIRRRSKANATSRRLDQLEVVKPNEIDFTDTTLIVVPSYAQPPALESIIQEVQFSTKKWRQAHSYDEALALVRAGQGVAFVSESFAVRDYVNAFKLEPADDYLRTVGVYFNKDKRLSKAAMRPLRFLCTYLDEFADHIQITGDPPAYGDAEFDKFVNNYDHRTAVPPSWQQIEDLLTA